MTDVGAGLSAQALYDNVVKEQLSPGLRGLGSTGSAGRYALPAAGCWALLGLQKSAYSDRGEIRFTANLLVANKERWATLRSERSYLPERPAALDGSRYGEGYAQSRIGDLLPEPADTWWRVYDGVDLDAVARSALHAVEHYGLPWMREHIARQGCD